MDRIGREDRQALQRIVALLFAFAALAECAGTKPRPIRVAVLWLLRTVESIAREFVVAIAHESGVDPNLGVPAYAHDITDDAERLARSFAVLAGLLADLTRRSLSAPLAGRISGPANDLMQALRNPAHLPGAPERPLPDTS